MNGAEFQQYAVAKVAEAYDRVHRQPTGETSEEARAVLDPQWDAIVAKVMACPECAECRRVEWPPSRKCNAHYCESDDYQRARTSRLRQAADREVVWAQRAAFIAAMIERANQVAQLFVNEVEAARLGLPTDDQAAAMEAHEMELRRAKAEEDPDLATLEGEHATDCAVFTAPEKGECDCQADYGDEPDDSMDGDHASALASVFGEND